MKTPGKKIPALPPGGSAPASRWSSLFAAPMHRKVNGMDVYFARQPILDQRLQIFGYELLFRSNPDKLAAGNPAQINGDYATSVVMDAANIGGIENITGGAYAFVNFTKSLLLDGVATLYPKKYLVVEVLENIQMDNDILASIRALREEGYLIALDDYIYRPGDEPLIELSDIIKVEVDGSASAYDNLRKISQKVHPKRHRLLAEKVETQEIFEKAASMGCTLFQGYFFAKPQTIAQKTVAPLKINRLRLVQKIMQPEMDYTAVSDIIKNDVSLSYKMLRLVNTAYYGIPNRISSIHHAVVFLGSNELKKWVTYLSLTDVSDNKPPELIIMSMVRAYFCERVAKMTKRSQSAEAYFLAGLFSLLDTLIDSPLESCLQMAVVPSEALKALLEKDNPGRYALDLIIALENGKWEDVSDLSQKLGLDESQVAVIYMEAIEQVRPFSF